MYDVLFIDKNTWKKRIVYSTNDYHSQMGKNTLKVLREWFRSEPTSKIFGSDGLLNNYMNAILVMAGS
jgi:hypothetical protein